MTKLELLKFLEPFTDEIEIVVGEEQQRYDCQPQYEPTGHGVAGDCAAVVLHVDT